MSIEKSGPHDSAPRLDALELQNIRIFANAASVTLNRLNMVARQRSFAAGDFIFRRGEQPDAVMLLLRGIARATVVSKDGREVSFRRIVASEVLGDYSALDCEPRTADVVAVTDVDVATLPAEEFVHLVTADPRVALAQMCELVSMIRELSERVLQVTSKRASERLVDLLLKMAEPTESGRGVILGLPTHAEMASLISSQRHVVTTELGLLEKQNLISRHGHDLLLPDVRRLKALLDE